MTRGRKNEDLGGKNFALLGVAGYIAPKHLQAIRDTGNNLVVACDITDSVGLLDAHFPDAEFFTDPEMFQAYVEEHQSKNGDEKIDYITICTPNFYHYPHIRLALNLGADAVCEKPLVVIPSHLDELSALEKETGQEINTILQIRKHPAIVALKKKIDSSKRKKKYNVELTYVTPRGKWYFQSWKGDYEKSGAVATNIGIHFFDMLTWLFGDVKENILHYSTPETMSGFLNLEKADVSWFLSVDRNHLPEDIQKSNKEKGENRAYRSITIDEEEIDFSAGFTELHTEVYKSLLTGDSFGIEDVRPAIVLVWEIGKSEPSKRAKSTIHPYASKLI